jgi:hypothetical protein
MGAEASSSLISTIRLGLIGLDEKFREEDGPADDDYNDDDSDNNSDHH